MSEFHLAILVYVPLQLASFLLLSKWWKFAAAPALLAAPGIFSHGGYMGDVFATLGLIIASVYLGLVLAVALIVSWISGRSQPPR